MPLQTWLLFCATETVLCFTPGPAVLLVVSLALGRGSGAGLAAAAGILTANAFYFTLSATGIGAVLLASWELFFLIKWLGALYLFWLGLRMFFARKSALAATAEPTIERGAAAPFTSGVITQGANPKTLVFFTALLPQFVDPSGPVGLQVGILGISSILLELGVLALYTALCQRARHVVREPRFAVHLNRAGGLLLMWAGTRLAALRRS
jgi:homoserine/homoserine lactone efflux protein